MYKRRNILIMLLVLVIAYMDICVESANQTINNETLLIKHLFTGYDPKARPLLDTSRAVDVNMGFQMTSIDDVDTKSQSITISGWCVFTWSDDRLTWNASEYNLSTIVLPPSMVWLPSVVVYNMAGLEVYNSNWRTFQEVLIDSNGFILWTPGGLFQAKCAINIQYFPYDDQICTVKFGFWMHEIEQALLHVPESKSTIEKYQENEEWELVNHSLVEMDAIDRISWVALNLHLRRRHLFYTANVILVTVFLAALMLMVFKLPVESGEKISMGVTLLLAFSVFILMVNEHIPESSMAVPIIIIYLLAFMAFSTLGICESVFVLYCYHHEGSSPPPKWLDTLLSTHISKTCKKKRKEEENEEPVTNEKQVGKTVMMCNKQKWQKIGLLTDYICFWLYLVSFTVLISVTLVIVPKMGRLQLE